jgi:myosin-crossreactive antigen
LGGEEQGLTTPWNVQTRQERAPRLSKTEHWCGLTRQWLDEHGVVFEINARVTDLDPSDEDGETTVKRIVCESRGCARAIGTSDDVVIPPGVYDRGAGLGTMERAPVRHRRADGGARTLWEKLHLAEQALTAHCRLRRLEGLTGIVIATETCTWRSPFRGAAGVEQQVSYVASRSADIDLK